MKRGFLNNSATPSSTPSAQDNDHMGGKKYMYIPAVLVLPTPGAPCRSNINPLPVPVQYLDSFAFDHDSASHLCLALYQNAQCFVCLTRDCDSAGISETRQCFCALRAAPIGRKQSSEHVPRHSADRCLQCSLRERGLAQLHRAWVSILVTLSAIWAWYAAQVISLPLARFLSHPSTRGA